MNEDYGDPILVPRNWYGQVRCYQAVWRSSQMGYEPGHEPVVLLGALHCRIHKRGTARHYGTDVLARYVRMLRITETDQRRWMTWVERNMLPVLPRRRWWPLQRRCFADLCGFVSEYSVLIDGEQHICYGEARRAVEMLHRAHRRLGSANPINHNSK